MVVITEEQIINIITAVCCVDGINYNSYSFSECDSLIIDCSDMIIIIQDTEKPYVDSNDGSFVMSCQLKDKSDERWLMLHNNYNTYDELFDDIDNALSSIL